MIKAFLFDYDGVITPGVNDGTLAVRISKNLNVPISEAKQWLKPIWRPLLKAEITEDEVWMHIAEQYGQPVKEDQKDVWFKSEELEPLPEMVELVRALKSKGYKTGLLSNATPATAKIIRQFGAYKLFTPVIFSYEAGMAKPDPEIFQLALKQFGGLKPAEVIFLDDHAIHTAAASKLGFQTITVVDHSKVIAEINKITG